VFVGKEGVTFFNENLQGPYWHTFEWIGILRIGPEAIWQNDIFSCGPPTYDKYTVNARAQDTCPIGYVNLILRLFWGICLHTTSDENQTRPEHTTQTHSKHHHHGGGSARPSSDMDLMNQDDQMCGRPEGGVGWGRGWRIIVENHKLK